MRLLLIAVIFGIGISLTGCVPFFVERRHDNERRDDGRHDHRDQYRDSYNRNSDRTDR